MNIDKDPELNTFFQKLRKMDEHLDIPPFPKQEKKSPLMWWIPLGIAAAVALGFFLWPSEEPAPEPPAEVIIITLQKDEHQKQQILIEEKTLLETWESPTESLLAEY